MKIWLSMSILLALLTNVALAESELDPRPVGGHGARLIVNKLDPVAGTVTTYAVPRIDDSLRPDSLARLPEAERTKKLGEFLSEVVRPENKLAEAKAEKARIPESELGGETSTPAWGWRWRGYCGGGYYGGGWYGGGYYGGWGGYSGYYTPYWNCGGYGGYGGYYGYGSGYYGGYYGGQYPYYTLYGNGW